MQIDRKKCTECGKCEKNCLNSANEIIGKEMTAEEVVNEVMKDKIFYETSGGGVTVTGGEPSYQAEFTLEILRLLKEAGVSLAIETCGMGTRKFYEETADSGATFLYDIKCIDPVKHKAFTGVDNAHILSNLKYLMDRNADIIIRLPLIPDCNDSKEDIALLADFLKENEGRYRYAEIMPYHTLGIGKSEKIGVHTDYVHSNAGEKEKSRWISLFASYGTDVRVSE